MIQLSLTNLKTSPPQVSLALKHHPKDRRSEINTELSSIEKNIPQVPVVVELASTPATSAPAVIPSVQQRKPVHEVPEENEASETSEISKDVSISQNNELNSKSQMNLEVCNPLEKPSTSSVEPEAALSVQPQLATVSEDIAASRSKKRHHLPRNGKSGLDEPLKPISSRHVKDPELEAALATVDGEVQQSSEERPLTGSINVKPKLVQRSRLNVNKPNSSVATELPTVSKKTLAPKPVDDDSQALMDALETTEEHCSSAPTISAQPTVATKQTSIVIPAQSENTSPVILSAEEQHKRNRHAPKSVPEKLPSVAPGAVHKQITSEDFVALLGVNEAATSPQ